MEFDYYSIAALRLLLVKKGGGNLFGHHWYSLL